MRRQALSSWQLNHGRAAVAVGELAAAAGVAAGARIEVLAPGVDH